MRLSRLQVTNYRSLFGERVDINVAPGVNARVCFGWRSMPIWD